MTKILEKKSLFENVDLIEDREYILEKLNEVKNEKSYTLEETYDMLMLKIEKFKKDYEKI